MNLLCNICIDVSSLTLNEQLRRELLAGCLYFSQAQDLDFVPDSLELGLWEFFPPLCLRQSHYKWWEKFPQLNKENSHSSPASVNPASSSPSQLFIECQGGKIYANVAQKIHGEK